MATLATSQSLPNLGKLDFSSLSKEQLEVEIEQLEQENEQLRREIDSERSRCYSRPLAQLRAASNPYILHGDKLVAASCDLIASQVLTFLRGRRALRSQTQAGAPARAHGGAI